MNSTDEARAILKDGMVEGDCQAIDQCRCADCFQYAREVMMNAIQLNHLIQERAIRQWKVQLSWENGFRD